MRSPEQILREHDSVFAPLEDTLTIRNYVAATGGTDDYLDPTGGSLGDRDLHPDSPTTARGSVDRSQPTINSRPEGTESEESVTVYVEEGTFVTGGGDSWNGEQVPYGSEIEMPESVTFVVTSVLERGNGRIRCAARREEH